jgi:hypothetical protein
MDELTIPTGMREGEREREREREREEFHELEPFAQFLLNGSPRTCVVSFTFSMNIFQISKVS